jgi:hypothetical protein
MHVLELEFQVELYQKNITKSEVKFKFFVQLSLHKSHCNKNQVLIK